MGETMDVPSPNSLLEAEGDVDSSFGEPSPEENTAETQAADALCTMGGVNVGQTDEHAGPAVELCFPHTAASTTSQTGEKVNQAMDTTLEPAGPEASHAEADQALVSTVAPGVSGPSPAEATMISTSKQEPESRDDVQPTAEPMQLPESPRRVVSATGQEGERNAQESDTQAVTGDLGTRVDNPIEADESMVDTDGIASADSSECCMDPETTPATSHTTSRHQDASRGRRSMTQESSDLPISIHGDELSESIIIDDNGGEAIIVHSDDEMDDGNSCQNPRCRVSRKRVPPRLREIVHWMSKEHKARSAANITAAWKKLRQQWRVIYAQPDRKLHQILEPFDKELSDVVKYELWNEKYREDDGRRLHRCLVTYGIENRVRGSRTNMKLVRRLGETLQQLQEEEERASRYCAYNG